MKILLFVIMSVLFMSCNHEHTVKLKNGSKVVARSLNGIDHAAGDTVCVEPYGLPREDWYILANGEMKDTMYTFTAKSPDNTERTILIERRIGVIIK